MKNLHERIIGVLERNDWLICGIDEHNGGHCAEIETYSPAGEDFIASVWYDGTSSGFVRAFSEYALDFDPDEHAEMWVESRGKNGVPHSIRALINDADAIADLLCTTAADLAQIRGSV